MLASIPSPPSNGLHVGPLFVHAYGLMYVFAVMAAVVLTRRLWESRGGDRALVDEVAIWGFPAGLIGGRLYHDLTSWNEVPHAWWGPFAIWKGGLGIWGGIALGTAAGLVVLRRHRTDIPAFLDAAAPGLLVAQAIGRVGNYFNQELFGGPTSVPWGLRIDPAHRPAGYAQYATFHPTFLYELMWNLALAGLLVWLWRRRAVRPPGLFALYVAGYSLARIGEELLRVDPAHRILGLRLNFYVAAALFAAGALWFVRTQWPRRSRAVRRGRALLVGVGALVLAGCGHERDRPQHAVTHAQCAWPWACGTAPAGTRTASIAASPVVTGTQSSSASVPISVAAIGSASCWPLIASASGVCVAWSASRNGSVAPT